MNEDTRTFEQRLKSLQSDRDNITIPKPQGKINFQDEDDIRKKDLDEIPDFQPKSIDQIRQERENNTQVRRDAYQEREQNAPRRDAYQEREQNAPRRETYQERIPPRISTESTNFTQSRNIYQQNESPQDEEVKYIPKKDSKLERQNNLKKIQESLKKLGMNPGNMEEINKLRNENNLLRLKLQELMENNKMDEVKHEIAEEFEKLNHKNEIIAKKEAELKKLLVK